MRLRARGVRHTNHRTRITETRSADGHNTISVPSASFGCCVSPSTLVTYRISLAQTCGEFRPMTPNFQAPRPLHPRAYLRGNQLLASNRRLNAAKSHPYLKNGGWGDNHGQSTSSLYILLVCLFVFEIVGCAGGIKSGTTTTGTGSGSTSGSGNGNGSGSGNSGGSGSTTTIPAAPTGVMATAGNAQVAVTWTASSGATSYHVSAAPRAPDLSAQIHADFDNFRRHRHYQWHELFLCRVRAELRRRKRQFNRSQREANRAIAAAIANSTRPDQPHRHRRQRANLSHMGYQLRGNELSREAQHDDRRALLASLRANDEFHHRRQPHQRHKIFLRRFRGELFRRERKLRRSQRHAERAARKSNPRRHDHDQSRADKAHLALHLRPEFLLRRNRSSADGHARPRRRQSLDRLQLGNQRQQRRQRLSLRKRRLSEQQHRARRSCSRVHRAGSGRNGAGQPRHEFRCRGSSRATKPAPSTSTALPDLSRSKLLSIRRARSRRRLSPPSTPPTTDANVYMDEFVWALNQKLPGIFAASPTHPTFINLDNEPELWNSTHLEVQGPNPVTSDNYITKTINLTEAIKDQFPNAIIFGPVHYGFEGIYSWQGELSPTPNGTNWFPDKYLTALKTASTTYGKPLVDVYDFHWYAEDYDVNGTRILDLTGTTLTAAQVQLIVQSPRNLWDPTFNDQAAGNSNPWIYQTLGNTPINILGRLQAKINAENPGMKVSVSEYESGGWNHIAGTIAQTDNLGIFGAQGVSPPASGLRTAPIPTRWRASARFAISTARIPFSATRRCNPRRVTSRMSWSMPAPILQRRGESSSSRSIARRRHKSSPSTRHAQRHSLSLPDDRHNRRNPSLRRQSRRPSSGLNMPASSAYTHAIHCPR